MEDDHNFSKMEDDIIFFKNGRRPQFFQPFYIRALHCSSNGFYVLYSFSIFSEQNLVCVAFRRTRACKGNKGNFDIDDSAIEVKLSDVLTEKRTHRRKRLSCPTTYGPHGSAGLWCCASYLGSLS